MELIKTQAYYLEGWDEQEEQYVSEERSLSYFEMKEKVEIFRTRILDDMIEAEPNLKRDCWKTPFVNIAYHETSLLPIDYQLRKSLIDSSWIAYCYDSGKISFLLKEQINKLQLRREFLGVNPGEKNITEAAWIDGLLNSLELGEL